MALLHEFVRPTPALVLELIAVLVLAFSTLALFNLTKHSLSGFPGPRLWACSRIPYVLSLQNGTLPVKIKALHDIYGPVVRIAPNELSFISPKAWDDIYSDKRAFALERGAIFYGVMGQNTFLGAGHDAHARMRRVISPAFRPSTVRSYEETMRRYVHLLVERLGFLVDKNKKACAEKKFDAVVGGHEAAIVDIVRWLNFACFDLAGNFVYGGDPFGCLRRSELHPWVGLICSWVKASVMAFSVRFYAPLDRVLMLLMPPSLRKQKEEFGRLGRERLQKRILGTHDEADAVGFENEEEYNGALPQDMLSLLISNKGDGMMTMAEMEESLPLLVIGGSETIATVLSGTINYLCQNAAVLKKLTDEVRTAVHHKEDLTLAKLDSLPYLTAVLKEGLRIVSPSVVSLPRIVPAEGISIDGNWVPGHNIVAVNPFAAARSATNFYQPLAFMPERWLHSAVTTSTSSPFASDKRDASKHFGGGARDCLGQGVAWAEMRLIMAGLVWAFDIEAVRALDWAQQKTYLVWEKEPFEVRLQSRVE